ncbi:hypothetical protein ID866_3425 [Astraeus odoratus]|nr:hypothetical protein ID866_3425 [Astraeus odoratus]
MVSPQPPTPTCQVPVVAVVDPEELYKTRPPAFGHEMRKLFGFNPGYVNLNNGANGSLPLPVRAAYDTLTTELEANTDLFRTFQLPHHMKRARERVAKLIGAATDECVFVNNTSLGVNTVLRNFSFDRGDVLIKFNVSYATVSNVVKYLGDIPPSPTVSTFNLLFPMTPEAIIQTFREHIRKVKEENNDLNQTRKFVAVIDSIVSHPGILLPWKEMVAICRDAGVYSLIDGAHSIGQELDINLSEARPDFWISSCHKWLYTKRGCAILYVPKRNQHIIKSPIPTSKLYLSHQDEGYEGPQDFVKLFASLDFREWIGGEHKINEYTHNLAIEGGKHLAKRFETSLLDPDGLMTPNMVNVELPMPWEIHDTEEVINLIRDTLLLKWNTFASYFRHNGKWWARCSVQIYNEISDFDVIADAFLDACAKVKELHTGRTR